jgi:hypothetical protein
VVGCERDPEESIVYAHARRFVAERGTFDLDVYEIMRRDHPLFFNAPPYPATAERPCGAKATVGANPQAEDNDHLPRASDAALEEMGWLRVGEWIREPKYGQEWVAEVTHRCRRRSPTL